LTKVQKLLSSLLTLSLLLRKLIPLVIIDEESYEKSLIMYVNIGDPRHIAGKVAECRLFLEVKFLERRNIG
jgi:hypothetical protein